MKKYIAGILLVILLITSISTVALADITYPTVTVTFVGEKNRQTMDDVYIEFVKQLIENKNNRAAFDSWRNRDYNCNNTGHLLLEFTYDSLKNKELDSNSLVWTVKDGLWGISSLGLSTLYDLLKYATGNGDGVEQYREILEESYLIYANMSIEKVNSFAEPWIEMEKVVSKTDKWKTVFTKQDLEGRAIDFGCCRMDDVLFLKKELDNRNIAVPELDTLAGQIKEYQRAGIISSTGSLIFDEWKLIEDLKSYSANKALFLAALTNASEEVMHAIDMLQESSDDKDFVNAVYKFRQEYKAAVTGAIKEYVQKDTFLQHWDDIDDYGISLFNYLEKSLGGRLNLKTSVWKLLDKARKDGAWNNASLLISTATMASDMILGTSKTQKTVDGIDRIIKLKKTANDRIDSDLTWFKNDQTAENARRVITDIKLLKSYQILGEQYALSFYKQVIETKENVQASSLNEYYRAGNMKYENYTKQLKLIYEQGNKEQEKFERIVSITNKAIESFSLPEADQ